MDRDLKMKRKIVRNIMWKVDYREATALIKILLKSARDLKMGRKMVRNIMWKVDYREAASLIKILLKSARDLKMKDGEKHNVESGL